MMKLNTRLFLMIVTYLLSFVGCSEKTNRGRNDTIILATTTSTHDSGLLDALIPLFEKREHYAVKTVAVGTGQALELGRRGEADVLLVHAPKAELKFIEEGHGKNRRPVMHNDFVIVGPSSDPANIRETRDIPTALNAIKKAQAPWVSRGDRSGTHMKEKTLWQTTGPISSGSWFWESGQGMGATLRIANERKAYTLADRGTFLAARNLSLKILMEGDKRLFNPYHIIEVTHRQVDPIGAKKLAGFFLETDIQQKIGAFTVNGHKLFTPDAI